MPYHPWRQFLRQKGSLQDPEYWTRAPSHTRRADFPTFTPQDAAILSGIDHWMIQTPAGLQIRVGGLPQELFRAMEAYGAVLERALSQVPPTLRPTAVGAIMYDTN
jgi:hypothetical protein